MKSIIVSAFLFCAMAFTRGTAQTFGEFKKMSPLRKALLVTDSLSRTLALSVAQNHILFPIVQEAVDKISVIIQGDDSRSDKRQAVKSVITMEESKLGKMLTATQFSVYQFKKQKAISYYKSHWMNQVILFNVPD